MASFASEKSYRGVFDPKSASPYKLSRSKIDSFLKCKRCFYLDRRLSISQPSGPAFSLNSAVDKLLKKEFDIHRAHGNPHPLMQTYHIDAVPLNHPQMDEWRENFKGAQYRHPETNLIITGAVDDIWIKPNQELIIVDYKSTSVEGEVSLDSVWKDSYKRQMEVYQWIFRRLGFTVSSTGYFVYCNGNTDNASFDGKLEFRVTLIPYKGDDSWVEETIYAVKECLMSDTLPLSSETCEYCSYRNLAQQIEVEPLYTLPIKRTKKKNVFKSNLKLPFET